MIAISSYLEAKYDYGNFIIFFYIMALKFYRKKLQVILSKNEGVTLIFPIKNEIKIRENCGHALIFTQNQLKFFVQNLRTKTKKKL